MNTQLEASTFLDRLAIQLAMAGGIGKAKKAPGTFGSLPGLGVGWAMHQLAQPFRSQALSYHSLLVTMLVLLTALSFWAIARTERVLGIHDDQRIVIDEVAGQAIATGWLPFSWLTYLVAFALFRLFDITKPGPIGWIDRDLPGAAGTLGDDLLAGVCAAIVGACLLYFLPESLV